MGLLKKSFLPFYRRWLNELVKDLLRRFWVDEGDPRIFFSPSRRLVDEADPLRLEVGE